MALSLVVVGAAAPRAATALHAPEAPEPAPLDVTALILSKEPQIDATAKHPPRASPNP